MAGLALYGKWFQFLSFRSLRQHCEGSFFRIVPSIGKVPEVSETSIHIWVPEASCVPISPQLGLFFYFSDILPVSLPACTNMHDTVIPSEICSASPCSPWSLIPQAICLASSILGGVKVKPLIL